MTGISSKKAAGTENKDENTKNIKSGKNEKDTKDTKGTKGTKGTITITIIQPVYGSGNSASSIQSLKSLIEHETGSLDAVFDVSISNNRFVLNVSGEDSVIASNLFLEEFGRVYSIDEIVPGEIYKGYISKIEKEEVCVCCGPEFSISAGSLKSLGSGIASQIATRFGFVLYQPVSFYVLPDMKTAEFSKEQIDTWWSWKKSSTDKIIVNSATRSRVKSALKKKGHGRDVYGVEKLGLFESLIICRENTDAPGIVASIGPLLKSDFGVIIGDKK